MNWPVLKPTRSMVFMSRQVAAVSVCAPAPGGRGRGDSTPEGRYDSRSAEVSRHVGSDPRVPLGHRRRRAANRMAVPSSPLRPLLSRFPPRAPPGTRAKHTFF